MQLLNFTKSLQLLVLIVCLLVFWEATSNTIVDPLSKPHSATQQIEVKRKNLASDDLWRNIVGGFKIDHREESQQVKLEIKRLLADEGKLYSILKASAPYIYFIHQQSKAKGLPSELALIPVIESEYNPNGLSKKGASGLWQLMTGTAHELGVKVKSGYDGRRNVVASTKAALAYFKDLGINFKDNWYLAIAAYNCGQGRVESVERRTGSHNFWNLPLPKETKYYVPRLLAVAAIIENPEKYGIKLPHIDNHPYFAEVKVKKSVNLKQVAKMSGISIQALKKLNPDYKNDTVIKKNLSSLLVPIEKVAIVKSTIQTI
ncbi:MAG: transglycosylase SLT domain-containing protein [Gammaproteobacteria bacterium]|nr:transglycosylase SLT domain-containing protein [Gammaproteobacteria bacterium]